VENKRLLTIEFNINFPVKKLAVKNTIGPNMFRRKLVQTLEQ